MDGALNKHARTKSMVHTLPFQRNLGFFGRESILNEIEKQLRLIADSPQVRSVAMWGIGGIGKSQIALEFAHRRWLTGNNVILWISSETDAEIAKSFDYAAARLQLSSYQNTNTSDQNRWAVLRWLQDSTDTPWLLVLDNVVDQNWLLDIWPVTGAGNILITCQSEPLAESLAATSIEIPTFNKEESGERILRILNRKNISQDDVSAAQELSEKLGGLALLLDIVAKRIKVTKRFKNVRDFLPYYEEHYRVLNKRLGIVDPYYSKDGHTLRQHTLAFQARYQVLIKDGFSEQDESFTRLMCDTAWYLLEIQSFRSCEQTLKLVKKNTEDKTSLAYAYVCTNFVSLYERTGRSIRAIPNARKALSIRQNESTDKNDLANGYSDVGYSSVAAYQAKEGLKNIEEALGIAEETPEPERHTITTWTASYVIMAVETCYWVVLTMPRKTSIGHYIFNLSYMVLKAITMASKVMYERAKIARVHKKDLKLAYELCERAYDLMSPGRLTHSSVMATCYQKGLVCSARGDSDSDIEAMQHFRNALTICQLNEAQRGNQGESARVKWRLSQVLERQVGQKKKDEAGRLAEEARHIKNELSATGDYPMGRTEDEEWDAFVGLLYR
ncbi:MAG: hypothetical protein Q9167_002486 [Letrouitia subvulpina]